MKDLAGRTAFVTGAASGIGLGIATALSQAGVKVMLCDIEEEALAKAISGLRLTNADVDGVRDVSLKVELQVKSLAFLARQQPRTPAHSLPGQASSRHLSSRARSAPTSHDGH